MAKKWLVWYLAACALSFAQGGKWQKPREIQKPRGTWQVPGGIQKPGEIQKVKEQCTSRFLVGSDALFEFDKAELTRNAEAILGELGPLIQQEGKHPIFIEGHTDGIGSADYNQQLSERRARAVRTWLENRGFIARDAAEIRGYGRSRPIAPNTNADGSDNPAGRQRNRRVEVAVNNCR